MSAIILVETRTRWQIRQHSAHLALYVNRFGSMGPGYAHCLVAQLLQKGCVGARNGAGHPVKGVR
jgi:hypothetical protein